MKGRKRLPDVVKKLKGTDKPYRLSGDRPIFRILEVETLPPPPDYMNEIGVTIYREVCKQTIELGLVNNANFPLMVAYAQSIGKHHQAETALKLEGMVIQVADKNGNMRPMVNPNHRISHESLMMALKIGAEFGLTPSAQSRIMNLIKKPESSNPIDDIINS